MMILDLYTIASLFWDGEKHNILGGNIIQEDAHFVHVQSNGNTFKIVAKDVHFHASNVGLGSNEEKSFKQSSSGSENVDKDVEMLLIT